MSSSTALAYLQLIQSIHKMESQGPFQYLDPEAVRLLEIITIAHVESRAMTVSGAMKLSNIASPASIHRKLEQLRVANLITHQFIDGNRRTKYLAPTALSLKHYDQLSAELMRIKLSPLESR